MSQITPPQIINPFPEPRNYCHDSVFVAPEINIRNIVINERSEGMKVSIINFRQGEDVLEYIRVSGLEYYWDNNYGILLIKGIGNSELYEDAIRKVYYKNVSEIPHRELKTFVITLIDADYLPDTEHFYSYIKKRGILWTEARDSSAKMSYYGLKGYLATITSSVENNFIWSKLDGIGWIGASDSDVEGVWKWLTGPEAGIQFWQGNYNGNSVNNQYSFWNEGEPNNVLKAWGADEDYAHINSNPNTIQKSWNDLSVEGDINSPNGYYYPEGFIVEFGGMLGDPTISLSAIAKIDVAKIAFSKKRLYDICEGSFQEINLLANGFEYTWTPNDFISDDKISNPIVNPVKTSVYKVVGKIDFCVDSAEFTVNVHGFPVSEIIHENFICKGDTVELNPGKHNSYFWNNMDTSSTLKVSDEGLYIVKLANEFNCIATDSAIVTWSRIPKLNWDELDTLVCGSKQLKLNLSFDELGASVRLISLQPAAKVIDETSLQPTIVVDEFGIYYFQMEISNQIDCIFRDTLKIEFHNQPSADFLLNDEKCKGYSLDLSYQGTSIEQALFTWFSNDTIFDSDNNLSNIIIPLGYGQLNRSVGLEVNEQGCVAKSRKEVSVIPVMNFRVEGNAEGCNPLNTIFATKDVEEIKSYLWDFGDGNVSDLNSPSHVYKNEGISDKKFDVRLTVQTMEGCENTGMLKDTITVHPIPTIDLDFEEYECKSETSAIYYSGSANDMDTILWDLSGFVPIEIIFNPGISKGPIEFKRSSEPTVEIGLQVVSQYGCKTDYFSKTFKRKPIFDIVLDKQEGCPPLTVNFTSETLDEVDQVEYLWNFGDGKSASGEVTSNIFLEPDTKSIIQVVANSRLTNCSDTLILSEGVASFPVPDAVFNANPTAVLISNPIVQFENKSEGATLYEWNFNDNTYITNQENPQHEFYTMGFYNVQLSAWNELGCVDTAFHQVSVGFDRVYPPNAFSPNANRREDREFRIYAEGITNDGYQLQIYNRWGEMIFESQSQLHGWDGTMKNKNFAPAGVYAWVIQYSDILGKSHKQQGTVTLLF